MASSTLTDILIDAIRRLPPEKVDKVKAFVESLQQHQDDQQIVTAVSQLSEKSFAEIWDNDSDADYDQL